MTRSELLRLRPALAAAAQRVYDGWDKDLEEELGGGGICDLIAEAMADVLHAARGEAYTQNSEGMGENHTWVLARCDDGTYMVDISPYVYERGGGYSWTKVTGVVFMSSDVSVDRVGGHDLFDAGES